MVREPVDADADAMGTLHVRAWQAAYRGVMPDAYLDALRASDRAAMWRRAIAEPGRLRLLVAEVASTVVGFAAFGPTDDEATGELYALNVDPAHWRQGAGTSLLRAVTADLATAGHRDAVLWVVPSNDRARALYEREGWRADGAERDEVILGAAVNEVRYRRPLDRIGDG